jgi:hypothetical protein
LQATVYVGVDVKVERRIGGVIITII